MTDTSAPATAPFITYEYQTVPVDRAKESLYSDVYRGFGWAPDGQVPTSRPGAVQLKFKRDRRIAGRSVLAELQRRAENALRSIDALERSKTVAPTIVSLLIGLVGVAFLAGSVFSLEGSFVAASVVLGAIGLAICVPPYFVYDRMRRAKAARVAPLIDREYETVYDTAEQAGRLLAQPSQAAPVPPAS